MREPGQDSGAAWLRPTLYAVVSSPAKAAMCLAVST
jgi:hypothetical protein